jgi:SAM-dependent methyltransferase
MDDTRIYWLEHDRYVKDGRMSWHAEEADEAFWTDYWQARVDAGYYEQAEQFDLTTDEMGQVLLAEMPRDGRHLEAGCGAGFWVAALRQAGLAVEGIEYAPNLVEIVNRVYPQLPVCYGDALAIDCPDGTYASYLSFGVVEHRVEGPEPFLAEAFRVVRPGGKMIISVPNLGWVRRTKAQLNRYGSSPPQKPFFQYAFSDDLFTQFIEQAGFQVTDTRQIYLHRLLLEESSSYRWLNERRTSSILKRITGQHLRGMDGHMLLIVAQKPER